MSVLDWIVIAGGVVAIVWVNWYFVWAAPGDGRPASHDHD
jgi:hypothetical protein